MCDRVVCEFNDIGFEWAGPCSGCNCQFGFSEAFQREAPDVRTPTGLRPWYLKKVIVSSGFQFICLRLDVKYFGWAQMCPGELDPNNTA